MAIQARGPNQFRVQVRRNGNYVSKTFETLREAREWERVTEGKVTGDEVWDLTAIKATTLRQAAQWAIDGKHAGPGSNAKNLYSKWRYWQTTDLADWSLSIVAD